MNILRSAKSFLANSRNWPLLGLVLAAVIAAAFLVPVANRYSAANADTRQPADILGDAIEKQQNGDNETAKKLYEIILIKAPKDSPTIFHANRGLMQIALGEKRFGTAERYFVKASKASVVYFHLFADIQDFYKNGSLKGHRQTFTSTLERVAKAVPADTNFSITLASFYRDIGEKVKAIEWYEFAIKHGASNAQLLQGEIDALRNG